MDLSKLTSLAYHVFFGAAFVLLTLSVLEKVASLLGSSIFRGYYTAGRLLEFAAMLIVFVIAFLLRQVRDELKKKA